MFFFLDSEFLYLLRLGAQSVTLLSEWLYNMGQSRSNFRGVNFQFGLKVNATYSGEHSDVRSLEL